jgi:short-subunit dehydrogenase
MEFINKVAVITGASTGIGRAISIKLASKGIKVILLSRSEEKLNETLNKVQSIGGNGETYPVDLTNTDEINSFCNYIKKSENHINYLFNVAAVWHNEHKAYCDIDFTDYTVDEILTIFKVGITAPTLLCHNLIPLMQESSHIVNVSGTFEDGAKGWLPYYISKKAIEDLTVGLADELKDKRIFVNCISPGDVASEAYRKFFPEYSSPDIALMPEDIAEEALSIITKRETGNIIVIKK